MDACPRGGEPGTVYLLEPDPVDSERTHLRLDTHGMNPMNVLRMVKSMGGAPGRVLIVGCEPADLGSDEEGKLGLSDPVEAAVDEAIAMIEKLVSKTSTANHGDSTAIALSKKESHVNGTYGTYQWSRFE